MASTFDVSIIFFGIWMARQQDSIWYWSLVKDVVNSIDRQDYLHVANGVTRRI